VPKKLVAVLTRDEIRRTRLGGGSRDPALARPVGLPARRVRHYKVDRFGKLTLRYLGRLRHIPVGVAHKNRKVRPLVAGADVRVVTEDGELLRALTLHGTRSYQALRGRWPVHNVLQQVSPMS